MGNITSNVRITGEVQTHIPPKLAEERRTAEKKKETREGKKLKLEIISAILIAIYAGLTLWQSLSANRSANAAQAAIAKSTEQFVQDQQPYLWPVPEGPSVEPETTAGKPGKWIIKVQNYGKSPAVALHCCMVGHWGTEGPKYLDAGPPEYNDPLCGNPEVSLVVPPNGFIFNGPEGKEVLTSSQAAIINGMDDGFVVRAKCDYRDTRGNNYQTAFCLTKKKNGVGYCGGLKSNYIRQIK